MTRGNQRELARQKNIKKQQEMKKGKASTDKDGNRGLSLEERRLRDAEILRLKQQKALEKKQQEQGKASA
ncbi:unnamed protein product [Larinioides sclopetarius]|uniref:Small EDRK-rich factor-like N-terminal domain-containing protein n=1 Tax=Larinioides sclopetarius TaxID=280406 RepID=A0AAV2AI24_9ARAC